MILKNLIRLLMIAQGGRIGNKFIEGERRYLRQSSRNGIGATEDSPKRGDEILITPKSQLRQIRAILGIGLDRVEVDGVSLKDSGLDLFKTSRQLTRDIRESFDSLRENRGLTKTKGGTEFYRKLNTEARRLGIDALGFTEVPPSLIFQGHRIEYPNAIVCIKEMSREAINQAPSPPAGMEAIHIYASLGAAINRLATFIRESGVPCQVSHPLGGFLLYPALAGKAGLGARGRQGLLITPQFGVRQRIGVILTPLTDMPITDSSKHKWVEEFCDNCNICLRRCPGNAIFDKAIPTPSGAKTSIDRFRCSPWFLLKTGCSICIKECPFSNTPYDRIKASYQKRR